MRVTIVTETYFPQVNGVSRTLGELVRVLTDRGDEVQLIHPDYGAKADPRAVAVRAFRVPFYRELHLPLPPFNRVREAIDQFRPDLVHIATEATLGLAVLRHAIRRQYPVVSSFHTNFDQYSRHYYVGWARSIIVGYLRWFHCRTRETYVPSRSTIAELDALGFERLALWRRGVDATLFRPDRPGRRAVRSALGFHDDDLVIGHVGRLAVEKNVVHLGDALAIVAEHRPRARMLIVGDGPARGDLEERTRGFAVFAGYRQGEDLADHYAAADVFAMTSLTETFGNVVLEAMASGLPVAAIRAGGVGETVQAGRTGLLVDPASPPDAFATALIRMVDDAALRTDLAHAARQYALEQSWDAIMEDLRSRYEAIVDERLTAGLAAR